MSHELLLEQNKARIQKAAKEQYMTMVTGLPRPCPPVSYGEFIETKKVLFEEIERVRNSEKAVSWLFMLFVAFAIWMWYGSEHRQRWEVDLESPAVASIIPKIFSSDKIYYRWEKDPDGNIGWVRVDKDGNSIGGYKLFPPEGSDDGAENHVW